MADLICISHLRWNHAGHRQQQVLSHFALHHRMLFIEMASTTRQPRCQSDNLTVMRFNAAQLTDSLSMLRSYLVEENYDYPLLWLMTPMGIEIAEAVPYQLLIYDVGNAVSKSQDLSEHESVLLRHANIVFTGTNTQYEAHCRRNPYTYLLPDDLTLPLQMEQIIQQRINTIYAGSYCICG